jgi:hypothetical protein
VPYRQENEKASRRGMAESQFFFNNRKDGRKDGTTGKIEKPEAPKDKKKTEFHNEQSCDLDEMGP